VSLDWRKGNTKQTKPYFHPKKKKSKILKKKKWKKKKKNYFRDKGLPFISDYYFVTG